MDLLNPITTIPLRAVQPVQATERGPRAVQASGQGFAGRFADERQAEDAGPHGLPSKPMFVSLLSDNTLSVLRQMVFRGLSYRIDDSGSGGTTSTGNTPGTGEQAAIQPPPPRAETTNESFSFSFTMDGTASGSSLVGLVRRATAAYTQAFSASPAFPFARTAESFDMVA